MLTRSSLAPWIVGLVFLMTGCANQQNGLETPVVEMTDSPLSGEASKEDLESLAGFLLFSSTVTKDQSRWTLPTDPYFGSPKLELLYSFAYETLMSECMHQAGYLEYANRWDLNGPQPENEKAGGTGNFLNSLTAAKYGYRIAPDLRDRLTGNIYETGFIYENESEDFLTQWDSCHQLAGKEMLTAQQKKDIQEQEDNPQPEPDLDSPVASEVLNSIDSQMNRLHVDVSSNAALLSDATKWRSCMEPLGIADLPDEPWMEDLRPPESLQLAWGWSTSGEPTVVEIEIAMVDANCRESSGWTTDYYEEEWRLAESFVESNRAALQSRLDGYKEEANHYIQLIENHY